MSLEEKYDEVRQLIEVGKQKGHLLYDEVHKLLPPDITTSDELDKLFTAFGSAGIEVVDSEQTYRDHTLLNRRGEGSDGCRLRHQKARRADALASLLPDDPGRAE